MLFCKGLVVHWCSVQIANIMRFNIDKVMERDKTLNELVSRAGLFKLIAIGIVIVIIIHVVIIIVTVIVTVTVIVISIILVVSTIYMSEDVWESTGIFVCEGGRKF